MKSKLIIVVDVLIFLVLILTFGYLWINNYHVWMKVFFGVAILAWLIYLIVKYYQWRPRSKISKIQLLNDREEIVKEWYIHDEQGLLIGKNFQNQYVNLDLSDADFAVLIEKQHATLNCFDGKWFLSDLGSRNGTRVKTVQASKVKRLVGEEMVIVNPGDRIYIAKSILQLVK